MSSVQCWKDLGQQCASFWPSPILQVCFYCRSCFGSGPEAWPCWVQVKILKKAAKSGKTPGPSRGVAFVEFASHDHAMAALRQMNNNPKIFGKPGHVRHALIPCVFKDYILSFHGKVMCILMVNSAAEHRICMPDTPARRPCGPGSVTGSWQLDQHGSPF